MVSLIILLLVQHSDHRAARQGLKQRANDLTERVRYPKHRLYSSPPEKWKCSGAGGGSHPSRTEQQKPKNRRQNTKCYATVTFC